MRIACCPLPYYYSVSFYSRFRYRFAAVRSLVGLDREAAKNAFGSFLQDKSLNANQIEFVNLIIDHLTRRGWMDASALYESPFTDLNPYGIDGLFQPMMAERLISVLNEVRLRAAVQ